ncbi:transposase [Bradyrhizobium sp. UFLA06-06]
MRHLVDRGLKGVQLVISDAGRGLVESVAEYLPDARYQLHAARSIFIAISSAAYRRLRFVR